MHTSQQAGIIQGGVLTMMALQVDYSPHLSKTSAILDTIALLNTRLGDAQHESFPGRCKFYEHCYLPLPC
jgi:hypothetical protein